MHCKRKAVQIWQPINKFGCSVKKTAVAFSCMPIQRCPCSVLQQVIKCPKNATVRFIRILCTFNFKVDRADYVPFF